MILRTIGGTILGAMALMIWGFLFWDVLLPPDTAIRYAPKQPQLAQALESMLPGQGTYFIPRDSGEGGDSSTGEESHDELVEKLHGVIAMIHFAPEGGDPLSAKTFTLSFVHFLITALLASLLLLVALPALRTYWRRAGFVFGMAVFGIFSFRLTEPAWYGLPWQFFLYVCLFLTVGWALAALVIAAVIRPPG